MKRCINWWNVMVGQSFHIMYGPMLLAKGSRIVWAKQTIQNSRCNFVVGNILPIGSWPWVILTQGFRYILTMRVLSKVLSKRERLLGQQQHPLPGYNLSYVTCRLIYYRWCISAIISNYLQSHTLFNNYKCIPVYCSIRVVSLVVTCSS